MFLAALIGAGLGFLWFNAPPAAVFMGDTGSLALGGALGAVAVATKHEIVLAIVGGLFVVETVSVIIQVFWYKRTGRRVFLMAPLHHHYEKKGWSEPTIVIRFWIVSMILALVGPGHVEDPMSGFRRPLRRPSAIAVVGLGRNGLPAAHALAAMGAEVAVWDDRAARARGRRPARCTTRRAGYAGFTRWCSAPASRTACPRRTRPPPRRARPASRSCPTPSCCSRRRARRGSRARFAGITGTNGKSTTTALLRHILATAGRDVGGGRQSRHRRAGPAAAAATTASTCWRCRPTCWSGSRPCASMPPPAEPQPRPPRPARRHGRLRRGQAAHLRPPATGDTAVVGIDDPASAALAADLRRDAPSPATQPADVWCDGGVLRDADGPILRHGRSARPARRAQRAERRRRRRAGRRARACDATRSRAASRSFPGLPHRQQRVATVDGVAWVNDSKATNADAAARALACYDRIVWIAGGMAKAGGIEPLRAAVPAHRPRAADRPRRAAAGRDAGRRRRAAQHRRARWTPPSPPPARLAAPAAAPTSCCCRPPAPASTSSPASRRAATGSRDLVPAPPAEEPPDADAVAAPTPPSSAAGGGRSTAGRCSRSRR